MRRRRDRGTVRACAGECVRAARERARAAGEYPSAAVGIWIRYSPQIVYNHRASARPRLVLPAAKVVWSAAKVVCPPPAAPAAQLVQPAKCEPAVHYSSAPYTRRLDDPCKLLRLSMLAIT